MSNAEDDTGRDRAGRILSRAVGLFGDGGSISPGKYLESWNGLLVALDVGDTGKMRLLIIEQQALPEVAGAKVHPVFEVAWSADKPAVVTTWKGGAWERAFTVTDA